MNVATGEIDDELIDWRFKGFPAELGGTPVSRLVADRPSLFEVGFNWPVMALRASAIEHNIGLLAQCCSAARISLAPHGKTTMAPALFERQLAAGAWAMTAATPWQARAYHAFGVRRVLLANELVDRAFVGWVVKALADPGFEFFCYVDSVAGVEQLAAAAAAAAAAANAPRPMSVLVEVGLPRGRSGARTDADVVAVADAVARTPSLTLVGVAGYEGPLGPGRDTATREAVRAYVLRLGALLVMLDKAGLLAATAEEFVLTCGGSAQIDEVSAALAQPLACSRPVRPVLRSGSYVTHDHGLYADTSSLAARLRPAIEVWCQVWSRPEPTLALLGAGRRDVSFDAGLPVPLLRRSAFGEVTALRGAVTKLNDQHAFLSLDADDPLDIGDLVCLGISHPCTALDKWQLMPLLDDERRVLDCVRSYF